MFESTPEIGQVCRCLTNYEAADMLEWDGTQWVGRISYSGVDLAPPTGCNQRAIWIGHGNGWTAGGEGFGLKLDKPFVPGREYSFTFTYAHTGAGPNEPFSPRLYTNNKSEFADTIRVGRLPASMDWATNTIKFVATQNQSTHDYLIIHAYEVSGIVLANCTLSENLKTPFLRSDTTLCFGEEIILHAPVNRFYTYQWSTGETTPAITVTQPGIYSVEVALPICSSTIDEVAIGFIDCSVYLEMPNVFTPNDDGYNSMFKPIKFNYLQSGSIIIFNRWGKQVFAGDLFVGWDGLTNGEEASTGVYYWECNYIDKDGGVHTQRGFVQLLR